MARARAACQMREDRGRGDRSRLEEAEAAATRHDAPEHVAAAREGSRPRARGRASPRRTVIHGRVGRSGDAWASRSLLLRPRTRGGDAAERR